MNGPKLPREPDDRLAETVARLDEQASGARAGDHCSACQIARELTEHRDATAGSWSIRRSSLNFARIIAERACSEYQPATHQGDA